MFLHMIVEFRVYAMAATQRPPTFVVLVMGNLMAHITGTTVQRVYNYYQKFVIGQILVKVFFSRKSFQIDTDKS